MILEGETLRLWRFVEPHFHSDWHAAHDWKWLGCTCMSTPASVTITANHGCTCSLFNPAEYNTNCGQLFSPHPKKKIKSSPVCRLCCLKNRNKWNDGRSRKRVTHAIQHGWSGGLRKDGVVGSKGGVWRSDMSMDIVALCQERMEGGLCQEWQPEVPQSLAADFFLASIISFSSCCGLNLLGCFCLLCFTPRPDSNDRLRHLGHLGNQNKNLKKFPLIF